MNFLDAHRILFDYIDVLATPLPKEIPFRGISELKNTKDEIINAYKLFIAHMFAFGTRTQKERENIDICMMGLPTFVDDLFIEQLKECQRVLNDNSLWGRIRNKSAIPFAEEKRNLLLNQLLPQVHYPIEEQTAYTDAIYKAAQNYRNEIAQIHNGESDSLRKKLMTINNYCQKAYQIAHIPMEENDVEFFYPFTLLRHFANDPRLGNLFGPYRTYIFENGRD